MLGSQRQTVFMIHELACSASDKIPSVPHHPQIKYRLSLLTFIKLARGRHPGKMGLTNAEWLGLFNQAAGKDLGDRFTGKRAIP